MNSKPSSKKSKQPSPKSVKAKRKRRSTRVPHQALARDGEIVFLENLSSSGGWGDEYLPAPHPLSDFSVDEMIQSLVQLKMKYPDYHLFFKLEQSPRIFGSVNWWELKGIRNV